MCNAKHTKLVPGKYGIFNRKCECGCSLPTLFSIILYVPSFCVPVIRRISCSSFNEKNSLTIKCPNCKDTLISDLGATTTLHYPIVGGRSAGKSSFLKAGMIALSELRGNDISFPDKKDSLTFAEDKINFKKGKVSSKIPDEAKSRAFIARIQNKHIGKPSHLIYMYDVPGKICAKSEPIHSDITNADIMKLQEYYRYINGIFFVLDPFSIFSTEGESSHKLPKFVDNIKPSENSPIDMPINIFNIMIETLECHTKKRKLFPRKSKYKIPIAIIITKSDLLEMEMNPSSEEIREWLKEANQSEFIENVEDKFTHVKYFTCSSLGHNPSEKSEFTPINVEKPLCWMGSFP